jgi:hypothetical protein
MEKQLILRCPTGYEVVCNMDLEQEKYHCCCCARPGSQLCETDPRLDFSI